jgi:hypothetical protein
VQSWGPSPFGIAKKIELKSAAASLDAFVMTAAARVDGAVKLLCGFSKSLLSIHSSIWSIQKKKKYIMYWDLIRISSDIPCSELPIWDSQVIEENPYEC